MIGGVRVAILDENETVFPPEHPDRSPCGETTHGFKMGRAPMWNARMVTSGRASIDDVIISFFQLVPSKWRVE